MAPGHGKERTPVIVNGLPGKMATLLAEAIIKSDNFYLLPLSLTGKNDKGKVVQVQGKNIELFYPTSKWYFLEALEDMPTIERPLIVDFTLPDAVNSNADFYCSNNLPFVMGTTGGDRIALEERVKASNISAVIAPNMAKPIVALQGFMQDYSSKNPDSLKDFDLRIVESHQSTKKDASGTAKAMIKYFHKLGIKFDENEIHMIRDEKSQLALGVPKNHLGGHGWHSYVLDKKDTETFRLEYGRDFEEKTRDFLSNSQVFRDYTKIDESIGDNVTLTRSKESLGTSLSFNKHRAGTMILVHNVSGRSIYVDGVMSALRFGRKAFAQKGRAYSMIDVINEKD